jgi:hypothetical protein
LISDHNVELAGDGVACGGTESNETFAGYLFTDDGIF